MLNNKSIRSRLIRSLAAAAMIMAAQAAVAENVTLRLATAAPEKSVWVTMIKKYKDRVAELSHGTVDVEIYPGSQLGTMDNTLSQMLRGRLDIYTGSIPYVASVVPELEVLVLPYLFDTEKQSVCVMAKLTAPTNAVMGDKGEFIAFIPVGWMNISSVKEVKRPADLAGEKIRSNANNVSNILLHAYGANPVPISPAETASALSTGMVSGGDNALAFWASTGQSRVSKHFLMVRHYLNTSAIIVGKRSWQKLSAAQKKAMHDATDVLGYPGLQTMLNGFEDQLIAKVKAGGATVTDPTPEELAQWRKIGLGTWDAILKGANSRTRTYLKTVQDLKAGCS